MLVSTVRKSYLTLLNKTLAAKFANFTVRLCLLTADVDLYYYHTSDNVGWRPAPPCNHHDLSDELAILLLFKGLLGGPREEPVCCESATECGQVGNLKLHLSFDHV